jgi:hypothetical protein
VDERKLTDLFEAAVRDAPPASFTELDVARQARRVTQHRRSVVAGSSALAVVVLAVGLLVGTGGFGQTPGGTSTSAGAALRQPDTSQRTFGNALLPHEGPMGSAARTRSGSGFPATTPMQGGVGAGSAGSPAGGTPSGCGPTDRELAVALANELPSVGATSIAPDTTVLTTLNCPSGARSAAFSVTSGAAVGDVIAVLAPAGDAAGAFGTQTGSVSAAAPAGGGRMLTILVQPEAGSPSTPLASRVDDIAVTVAAHL